MKHSITLARQKNISVLSVCAAMLLTSAQTGCATEQPQAEPSSTYTPAQPARPSSQELDQLVAPIALYPDALVAQVLDAATYPTEVVEADRWMQQNSTIKGDALAEAVNGQPWDPSVKALTQFPSVLEMMDKNIGWTSFLGESYGNNGAAVLDAIQRMRLRAQQAGNLKNTAQQTVTTQQQTMVIEPTDPDVVYLPAYDPWLVYGSDLSAYPGWVDVPGLFYDGPGLFFGVGIGIGVFAGFGWGWHHWSADWHQHAVDFDHRHLVSHSPTFGHFRPIGGASRRQGVSHSESFHPGGVGHLGGFSAAVHSSAFSGFNLVGLRAASLRAEPLVSATARLAAAFTGVDSMAVAGIDKAKLLEQSTDGEGDADEKRL